MNFIELHTDKAPSRSPPDAPGAPRHRTTPRPAGRSFGRPDRHMVGRRGDGGPMAFRSFLVNKFSAQKTEIDGIIFASKAEANRYAQLKLMERAKAITDLKIQPGYLLQVNGKVIGTYRPDFSYQDGKRIVVEDVKGIITPEASLRMRVFMAAYPEIELRIVDRKGNSEPFRQRRVTTEAA